MKLSLDIDRKLKIMTLYSLTAEQWLFIELMLLYLDDERCVEYVSTYFTECKKDNIPRETLIELKDKKILAASYKLPKEGAEFNLDEIAFSKTFMNMYYKESFEAGQELFEAYPKFLQYGDKLLPATNITKGGFQSLEDFFFTYGKAIRWKPELHVQVMEALSWAIQQELISYGIVEYVVSRKWIEHIKIMQSGEIAGYVLKISTMQDA